ncbi:SRPBCC family protein [Paraflavitalea speifideaquila]|uniref:SRPBCC family protein n=1 Tax=Paraflavitalea speifideaquila TaxID=3076558 RepID=UPI0028EFD234|nr:SRPBCC family protein [Paraflavitalea speifideiaquila]
MAHTGEQAVAGTTMGLIGLDETVTWKAKHLCKTRIMKVRITAMQRPYSFTDEMVDGAFKSMKHEHHFKAIENGTLAIDIFTFESPYGCLGKIVDALYLRRYMESLLDQRNKVIREYAESDKWKFVLLK